MRMLKLHLKESSRVVTLKIGIKMTESYAMIPEASICGLIILHPQARYHEIRRISREQYDDYASRRGMDEDRARRFLGHLLK